METRGFLRNFFAEILKLVIVLVATFFIFKIIKLFSGEFVAVLFSGGLGFWFYFYLLD